MVPSLTAEHGQAVVAEVLRLCPRPSALMCANDLLVLGALKKGLVTAVVRVPGNVALVG